MRRTSGGALDSGARARAAVRRQGHARDARDQGHRARDDRRRARATASITTADRRPRRHRHVGRRRAVRVGALRQPARRADRRAHDRPRRGQQKLVKLPDGSGLWLSTTRYLTPSGTPLHEKGLEPTVAVDEPDVEFGQPAPTTDPVLEKALERAARRRRPRLETRASVHVCL